jgi:hypothetical protein
MGILRDDLCKIGFEIEAGKSNVTKLKRPVFLGQHAIWLAGFTPTGSAELKLKLVALGWAMRSTAILSKRGYGRFGPSRSGGAHDIQIFERRSPDP